MKKAKLLLLCIALSTLLLSFVGCKKKENGKVTVTTKIVAEITTNSAKCGGKVTLTGDAEIGVCGVCWSESPSPTTNDFFTTDIVGAGEYISTMNSLKPNTKYFVRAYATLSSIVMYGEEMAFTTLSSGGGNGGGTGGDGTLSVTTNDITEITASSAVCGGNVTINGEVNVTAKGVCWSTSHSPTLENAHTTDGQGDGAFTSNLTGLSASTVYYVRAYATNNSGITTYGNEKDFTTQTGGGGGGSQAELPTIVTGEITEISETSAKCGGNVINNGGAQVTERGICWNTSPNPRLSNYHVTVGSGMGSYTGEMTGLVAGTIYYVCAYATNSAGTAYGEDVSFSTKELPPPGILNGLFSVSPTKQVYFSKGNLQYQASTNTWRFAGHQYDFVGGNYYDPGGTICNTGNVAGSNNSEMSSSYSGWIDLFGYGTSGYNNGQICYQPYSTSTTESDYYGSNLSNNSDWGYNAISGGGSKEGLWRTLTKEEWEYLLFSRSGCSFALVQITNACYGLAVFPDNWDLTIYNINNINVPEVSSSNMTKISMSDWTNILQANGVVLLPCCSCRRGTTLLLDVMDMYIVAQYWSASTVTNSSTTKDIYCIKFASEKYSSYPLGTYSEWKSTGAFVRLVHDK